VIICVYVSVYVSVCTEQYVDDVVDIEVSVNADVVGRRRLSYNFSSLSVACQLSTFYSRLLNVACHHHHHHHHHQQQQQQQHVDSSSVLDEALLNVIDDKCYNVACQTLFTVYRRHHCTSKCQCLYSLRYTQTIDVTRSYNSLSSRVKTIRIGGYAIVYRHRDKKHRLLCYVL